MKRRICISVCLAVMVVYLTVTTLVADSQAWINNCLTFKINPNFSLRLSNETRCNELTYMGTYLKNWQGGIVYNPSKNLYVSFLYKREDSKKTSYILHENRFSLESGWKVNLSKKAAFDIRFRTEIRGYEDDLAKDHLRFRLCLRIKTKMKIGQLKLDPFIAIEPFADTMVDEIFRYRFYAGFVFPMGKHAGFVINYIRQGTKDKESINILNTGVELKF